MVLVLALGISFGVAGAAGKTLVLDLVNAGAVGTVLDNIGAKDYVVVNNEDDLKKEFARLDNYKVLLFAYHELLNAPATKDLVEAEMKKLLEWVKAGGCILSTTRDEAADNILLEPFGLAYSGADASWSTYYEIADKSHPIFSTPKKIYPDMLTDEVAEIEDQSMVDLGLDIGSFKSLATYPDMPDQTVIAVSNVGKGKVVFTTIEVFFIQYVEVPTNLALVGNILDWFNK